MGGARSAKGVGRGSHPSSSLSCCSPHVREKSAQDPSGSATAPKDLSGGTLRVGVTPFLGGLYPATRQWDVQRDDDSNVVELARCCLGRTLLSYRAGTTADGGTILQPDIAAALPDVSSDGLTWTFHLKSGIHYGPPLEDVESAGDFVRAFERLLDPAVTETAYSPTLFPDVIKGAREYVQQMAAGDDQATIAGLEVPDPHTLRVSLNEPDGDLGFLTALPVLAPIPPDPDRPDARYGIAERHDRDFSGFIVSSGPYMLEGSERMDPAGGVPASGFTSDGLTLVRNPSWSSASDPLRPAYPDRIEILRLQEGTGSSAVASGRVDLLFNEGSTSAQIRAARPSGRVAEVPDDTIFDAELNVAVPPLDDPHVRRAIAAVIDRGRVAQVISHAEQPAVPAYHMALDSQEANLLVNYVPSWAGDQGSADGRLAAARAEMRGSRYDTDHDGRCDAAVCRGILTYAPDFPPHPDRLTIARSLAAELRPLGLRLDVVPMRPDTKPSFFDVVLRQHVAVRLLDGFLKDYPGAATFLSSLYGSDGIPATSDVGYNRTMLGASSALLHRYGFPVTKVPSVDARLEQCRGLLFSAAARCWADVDQFVMEELVPAVPIVSLLTARVFGPRVALFTMDQAAPRPSPALDAIAVRD